MVIAEENVREITVSVMKSLTLYAPLAFGRRTVKSMTQPLPKAFLLLRCGFIVL